jgi:hypothetical protein
MDRLNRASSPTSPGIGKAKAKPCRRSTRMNADQEIGLGMGWDEVE